VTAADQGRLPRVGEPAYRAPPGAVDCHHHVYDRRFAMVPDAAYRPGDATAADYRAFRDRLGFAASVVVQPSVYGFDHGCTLDAVRSLGASRAVAVIAGDESPAALRALGEAGTVGLRLQAVGPTRANLARLEILAGRAAEQGWHLQLHLDAALIVGAAARLAALDVDLVFDHFGRIPHPDGAAHPAFRAIADLVARGRTWVKLSAGYHFTRSGGPDYADVGALTRAFLALAPGRMLWGTDWPHPTETVKPDVAVLFDRFVEWAGAGVARQVLVDNPRALYGFDRG
jgi:predicted TIM-barrel fold metal-dependent hydrolase